MKMTKKLLALALALVMVLTLTGAALAATVTIPTEGILKDHTFTAYQVFSGTESKGILSDVQWGSGISSDAFLAALKTLTVGEQTVSLFKDCTDAKSVADVLTTNNSNNALANAVAKLAYANKIGDGSALNAPTTDLASGYYLVVDTTKNVGAGGAYNTALLQVVGNINITVKTDVPTFEKKVKEDDKYNQDGGYGTGYNDVADYNMGDAVPFHLIGSVPDMSRYDTYKYIFHDTLSTGLTAPNNTDIKVYRSNDRIIDAGDTDVTSSFSITVNGQSITASIDNLKGISDIQKGQYIIVEYSAVLNQSAVIGLDGNLNTGHLEYSNKPDQSGSGDTDNTGNTPEDKVIVFTYELDTTKVDGKDNNQKLKDAEFKLKNDAGKWAIVNSDNKVTSWADTEEGGSTLTSGTNGLFKVIGLDAGTYYLKETKAPAGYNLLTNEITVAITANTANGQNWSDYVASSALTALSVTADNKSGTADATTGIAGITIANNKGATLPTTGGMGTTLFYVLGSVLVIGAVVLLVSKKRMSKSE